MTGKEHTHRSHISQAKSITLARTKSGPVMTIFFRENVAAHGAAFYLWLEKRLQLGMKKSDREGGCRGCVDNSRDCITVKTIDAIMGVHELITRAHADVAKLFGNDDYSYSALSAMLPASPQAPKTREEMPPPETLPLFAPEDFPPNDFRQQAYRLEDDPRPGRRTRGSPRGSKGR